MRNRLSIQPDDWFNRFFGTSGWPFRRSIAGGNSFEDMFRGLDDMRREIERHFEESFNQYHQDCHIGYGYCYPY